MKLFGWLIPWWAYVAAVGLLFAAGLGTGLKIESWRWHAHEAAALKAQQAAFQKQLAQANNEATNYEHAREQNRVDTDRRQAEVRTIYKTVPVRPDCEPPASVRSVLNEAIDAANQPAAEPRR